MCIKDKDTTGLKKGETLIGPLLIIAIVLVVLGVISPFIREALKEGEAKAPEKTEQISE